MSTWVLAAIEFICGTVFGITVALLIVGHPPAAKAAVGITFDGMSARSLIASMILSQRGDPQSIHDRQAAYNVADMILQGR